MVTAERLQISFEERVVNNQELHTLLEDWQGCKEVAVDYRKLDKKIKEKIKALNEPLPFRIGRFVISEKKTPARHVWVDSPEGKAISIKAVKR